MQTDAETQVRTCDSKCQVAVHVYASAVSALLLNANVTNDRRHRYKVFSIQSAKAVAQKRSDCRKLCDKWAVHPPNILPAAIPTVPVHTCICGSTNQLQRWCLSSH